MNGHSDEQQEKIMNSNATQANGSAANGHGSKPVKSTNGTSKGFSEILKAQEPQASDSYTPIKSLNTFLFDWKIKARVTKKHNKKTWKNNRGQGTLLNVELIDNQGTQIQATFFND